MQTIATEADGVIGVVFTPDNGRLIIAGADESVRVWNWQTGEKAITFRNCHTSIHSMALSPAGTQLLRTDPQEIVIWKAPIFPGWDRD